MSQGNTDIPQPEAVTAASQAYEGYEEQQPEQDQHHLPQYSSQGALPDYYTEKPSMANPQGKTFEEVFEVAKPKWNDWPFTIFFTLVCIGFIVIAGITLKAYTSVRSQTGSGIYDSSSFTLSTNTIIMFVFAIIISVFIALFSLVIARTHPKMFIIISIIANVVMGIATAIVYFALGYYSAAIVFLVFSIISAWCYWSMRRRIPFSAQVLNTVIDVMKSYKSTIIVSSLGSLFTAAFSFLFAIVVVATYVKYDPKVGNQGCDAEGGSCSYAKVAGILFYVFFAGYFITEVTRNVIHVTISGVYGTWYYLSKSDQGEPKWPALGAFKRAMTYSFGSICFGSLIVTFIEIFKQFFTILRSNAAAAGETCATILYFFIEIILGVFEWLARFFNQYAFSYIALYGENYIKAARSTWYLLRQKGVDALVNQCLIGTALGFYALFNAYVSSFFVYLYLKFTKPRYNEDGDYYFPLVAFTFLMSIQISHVITQPLKSGTSTFFIALSKDPEVFQQSYPNRFDEIAQTYPEVFDKLRGEGQQLQYQPEYQYQADSQYQSQVQYA